MIVAKLTALLDRLVTTTGEGDEEDLMPLEDVYDMYWVQWIHLRKHPLWAHHKDMLDSYTEKHIRGCMDYLSGQSLSGIKLDEIVGVLAEDIGNVSEGRIKVESAVKLIAFAHSKTVWTVDQCSLFVNSMDDIKRDASLNKLIKELREKENAEREGGIIGRIKTWTSGLRGLLSNVNVVTVASTIGVLMLVLGILYSRRGRRHRIGQ